MQEKKEMESTDLNCSNCNASIAPEDVYCGNCGYPERGTAKEIDRYNYSITLKKNVLNDANKKIKHVRILLYIITAVSLIMGLFHISIDNYADGIALLIAAALYLACSIWVKKKPLIGIVTAFTLWLIFQLSVVLIDPVLLFKGIILKILVFSMFVKGIVSAKDAQSYSTQLKDLKAL